mgnify:CR=1 FL=1
MDFRRKKRLAALERQLAELKESYAGRDRLFTVTLEPKKMEAALKAVIPSILVDSSPISERVIITVHAGHKATLVERQNALTILNQLIDLSVTGNVLRDT